MMDRNEAEEALALIRQVVSRVHDETILHNRGIVMVVMGFLDLAVFAVTQLLAGNRVHALLPYAAVWGVYVLIGLAVNLSVRPRAGGTMTYVERHVWGNGLTFYTAGFALAALDCWFLPPAQALRIIPAHTAVVGAIAFAFMTLLDRRFFLYTGVFFAVAGLLAFWPDYGFALLGLTWCVCLVVPGSQYMRARKKMLAAGGAAEIG